MNWKRLSTNTGKIFVPSQRLINPTHVFTCATLWVLLAPTAVVADSPPGQVVEWGRKMLPDLKPGTVFTNIAARMVHNLALTTEEKVFAWGSNKNGESNVPGELNGVVAVEGGGFCSLTLKSDGTVVSWGRFDQSAVPKWLNLWVNHVSAIAAGATHCLAIVKQIPADAPAVTTLPATSVTTVSARLNGYVNPKGLNSVVHFRYGTAESYGNITLLATPAMAPRRLFSR
ncbi:MAG: hypothetical protein KIS67_26830 [Verrucomicrobiae bacterium]|nr:hypothetical protein [Verrucomicrobiae bacterium]